METNAFCYSNFIRQQNYDQSGRVSGYALSNVHDVQGCTNAVGAGCAGAANITLAYDNNNNITQKLDIANALNNAGYDYDAINRLIEENGQQSNLIPGTAEPYNKAFAYDGVGNRTSKTADTTSTYSYAETSNRLQSVDAQAYQ